MKFFIKKFSTLPHLEIDLEDISKKYNIKPDHWDSCAVTFSMYEKKNNIYRIANKEADIITKERVNYIDNPYNYYLRYVFTQKDTSNFGEFVGEFKVDFLGTHQIGKITIPVDGNIDIIIKDSITRTNLSSEIQLITNKAWYYGTYQVSGAFAEIPFAEDIDILSGNIVTNQNPKSNMTINFNSNIDDFVWFAIPSVFGIKDKWNITLFNSGNIGGPKISNGNLFPTPENIIINDINYDVYISNYRTKFDEIIIRKT